MIGTLLMGVLSPAIFWNRAHIVNRALTLHSLSPFATHLFPVVLGGAGLGSSMGLLTYYGRSLTNTPSHKSDIPVASAS
jgi:hypothetical protein